MARPRTYDPASPSSGTDRSRARRDRARQEGGRILQVILTREEAEALARLRKAGYHASDRDAVAAAILEAAGA